MTVRLYYYHLSTLPFSGNSPFTLIILSILSIDVRLVILSIDVRYYHLSTLPFSGNSPFTLIILSILSIDVRLVR